MRNAEVIRQWKILKRIEAGRYTTAQDMAEEHGVTERTIRRDIEALQAMPHENPVATCGDALSNTEFARRWGVDQVGQRMRAHWLEIVRTSMAQHAGTFAVLPLSALLGEGGYLAALRAEGYEIEAPQ